MYCKEELDVHGNGLFENSDNKQVALEEIATQELLNKKQIEIFENVVFKNEKRYYIEDLTQRDYLLENTTPYQLEILGHFIEEHSWGNLLCKVTKLLLEVFPQYRQKILDFRCQWTKTQMFTLKQKTNHKCIETNLFINCNHTALHSCWFLQDLLDFFFVDKSKVVFLIRRSPSAEPKKIKEYVENRFKRNFIEYITLNHNKTKEYANNIISILEKHIHPLLMKITKSYNNLFIFDDKQMLYNYVKKLRETIDDNLLLDTKSKSVFNKCLDYLIQYYKNN